MNLKKLVICLLVFEWLPLLFSPAQVASQDRKGEKSEKAQPPLGRLKMSEDVSQRNLVYKAEPVYPAQAKTARIEGIVILEVVISTEGTVQRAQVISGHPLLVQAAVRAVKQYRYKPFRLKGAAVEGVTTVTVPFSLKALPGPREKEKRTAEDPLPRT